jgi:RHS repeat-associated protein
MKCRSDMYSRIVFTCMVTILLAAAQSLASNDIGVKSSSNAISSTSSTSAKTAEMLSIRSDSATGPEFDADGLLSLNDVPLPDLFTGAMKYRIPIGVPDGLNSLKPNTDLVYRSTNGNGWLGVGWDVSYGTIVLKEPGQTTICPTTSDTTCTPVTTDPIYTFMDDSGSNELVLVDRSNNIYSYKVVQEDKRIRLIGTSGNRYWEITNTNGNKYTYGTSVKLVDPANSSNIAKWYIEKIVDPFGNYIKFNYNTSNNQIILSTVEYGGNEITGLASQYKIEYITENRTDTPTSYRYNVAEKISTRLSLIKINANGNLIKSYKLAYYQDTFASTLQSVNEIAPDSSSLLVANLGYTKTGNSFSLWANANYGNGDLTRYSVADVDGDGRTDIVYVAPGNPADIYVAKATATGLEPFQLWFSLGTGELNHYQFSDVNGDGKADLVYFYGPSDIDKTNKTCLSSGSSFANCVPFNNPTGCYMYDHLVADFIGDGKKADVYYGSNYNTLKVASFDLSGNGNTSSCSSGTNWLTINTGSYDYRSNSFFFPDLDGNRRSDVLYMVFIPTGFYGYEYSFGTGYGNVYGALSTGSNFVATGSNTNYLNLSDPQSFYWGTFGDATPGAYRLADYNGDGKSDLLWIANNGMFFTALSTGKGFVGANGVSNQLLPNKPDFSNFYWGRMGQNAYSSMANYFIGDFNGDGKTDLLMIGAGGNIYVAQSNGSQLVAPNGNQDWNANSADFLWGQIGDGIPDYYMIGDFNGDGKSDLAHFDNSGNIAVYTSSGDFNNLLNHIETRQGEKIDIQYTSSTNYSNTQLPVALPVVSSVKVTDGNPLKPAHGISATSTYSLSYSGGYYNPVQREFRGFNQVTVTSPSGPNGEQSTSMFWFHQGDNTQSNVADNPGVADAFMRGKPYHIRMADASGTGYVDRVINYVTSTDIPHFNPMSDVTVSECKDSATCLSSKTAYYYDSYGNIVRQEEQPDLSNSTYNRTITRAFAPNTTAWIVSLPSSEIVYQGIGTLTQTAETDYFYDSASSCSVSSYVTMPQQGKVTGIRYWLQNGTSPEVRMAYDAYGNKICSRDANLNTTSYIYDSVFNRYLKEIRMPNNKIPSTKFTYYGVDVTADNGLFGQLKTMTDANSMTAVMQYDKFGRKTRTDYPDSTWERTTYTDLGGIGVQNVKMANSDGLWKTSYYDGMSKTYKIESGGTDISKTIVNDTVFDARNTPYMTSFPYYKAGEQPLWTVVTRDYRGRVTLETKPDTSKVQLCYDPRIVNKIDANGHLIRRIYNGLRSIAEVDEFVGVYDSCASAAAATPSGSTTYLYDIQGRLKNVTDAQNNVYSTNYDSLGRKTSTIDPDMGTWSYGYDANGNLAWQVDANQHKINFANYDELNRLVRKQYINAQGAAAQPDTVYTYDETTSSYPYGRLTRMTDASGQTVYNYDTVGRIAGATKTIGGTTYNKLSFSYVNGRLDTITYPDNDTAQYLYDGSGNLQSVGNYATYSSYDALGRPGNISYGDQTSAVYSYDSTSKRLNELAVASQTQGLLIDNTYGYDNKGNITSITDKLNKTLPLNFSSETYTPVRAHAVGSTGAGRQFLYDNNGNTINDGLRAITYNYDNMPVTINSTSYAYDGNGKRVMKTFGNVVTTYIDKYYECRDGICGKYIYVGNTLLAKKDNAGTLYYHPDHQGSTAVVSKAGGVDVEDIAYYPFGATRQDSSTEGTSVSHKYTGQEIDGENGVYNYDARMYDPDMGRFLTPDSIVPSPYDPQSLNRYAYAQNNPVNLTDPTGHFTEQTADQSNENYSAFTNWWWDYTRNVSEVKDFVPPSDNRSVNNGQIPSFELGEVYVTASKLEHNDPRADLNGPVNFEMLRWPDFVSGSVSITIPTPLTGTLLSWSFSGSIDRYGNWYWSPIGPGAGRALTVVSGSLTANWLGQEYKPSPNELTNFLSGNGITGSVGFWGGGNVMSSPGNGWAGGLGFVSPQGGGNYSYSYQGQGNTGITW